MDYVNQLQSINWWQALIAVFIIVLAFKFVDELWQWLKKKLGIEFKWDKDKKEQTETITEHSAQLNSIISSVELITSEIDKLSNNLNGINQNIGGIDNRINNIDERLEENNNANIMQLYDRLESKTRFYRDTLHGIPSDEREGYILLYEQYIKLGGNHGMDIKVKYALDTLPTIGSSIFIMKQEDIDANNKLSIK